MWGLLDRRRRALSPNRVPVAELERILTLYRERHRGSNVRHFCDVARSLTVPRNEINWFAKYEHKLECLRFRASSE